jgi:two-component system phosphate regulon sensor histidine kinase PhoR
MSRRKLIWHLYPAFLGVGIVIMLAVTGYGIHSFHEFYYQKATEDLHVRARMAVYQLEPVIRSGDFAELDFVCKSLGKAGSTRITVIAPDGQVIGDSDESVSEMENHASRPEFIAAMKEGTGRSVRFSKTIGRNTMYLAIPAKQDNTVLAVVRTAIPVTDLEQELAALYKRVLWAGLIIAVCAAVVSFFLSQKLCRPIGQMREMAGRFASGDFSGRLSPPGPAELADLASGLNKMAKQLSRRIEIITEDKNQFQAILSSMVEGVIAVDSEGRIVEMNTAAADFWEVEEEKTLGRTIEEVIRHPELQQFIQSTLQDNESSPPAEPFTIHNGHKVVQLYGTLWSGGRGQKNGAVIVMHEITQIQRLEEIRSDFVANVSHELKTPITSIKGFVETLQEGAMDKPQEAKQFLDIIARHADRLNSIVDDLLSLSRLEEDGKQRNLSFENARLKPVLVSTVELSKYKAQKKNISIELFCDEGICAKINSVLIEQAVFNLVDNAIKYSPDNSPVKITVEKRPTEIIISVSDKGCGIEEQHLSRVFERFYVVDKSRSRRLGGTGLGLSIVKHISQVHGGRVTVESRVQQGSTFTIHLPVERPQDSAN